MVQKPRKNAKPTPKEADSPDLLPLFAAASPPASPLGAEQAKPEKSETPANNAASYQAEIEEAKARKTEATQEGRATALRYYERKRIALAREKKNQTEMIFIKAPAKGWYKAFDRSAIYFASEYGPKIGSKAKVKVDKDYQFQSKIGCVSIPNIDIVVEKLKKLGVELIDTKDDIYTFKLERRILADEYNLLKEKNQAIFERANKMIRPKELMPNLFEDAKDAFMTVFWTFRDMHEWVRKEVGAGLTEELREIIVEYTVMAKTTGEGEAFLESAMSHVSRADGYFMTLSPLRIINDEKMLEIAGKLAKLRNQVIFEKKRLAVQKINKETNGRIA